MQRSKTQRLSTPNEHDWGPALPGQGSSKICTKCGARQVVAEGTQCQGVHPEINRHTLSEYDPLETD